MPHKDPSEHKPHEHHVHIHQPHVHAHKSRVLAVETKVQIHKPKPPKVPVLLRRGPVEGRRFIECLWERYKGEEFWILGTGPSMDDYSDNFFDDKISIGLKSNFIVFPNTTFNFTTIAKKAHWDKALFQPEVLKKHIFGLRTQKPRFAVRVPREYWKYPVYMWQYRVNVRWPAHRALLREAIERIMKRKPIRYPHEDTVSHLAIQAAAIMGAKKIILVGCEEKPVKNSLYAQRYRPFYSSRRLHTTDEKVERFWKNGYRQRRGIQILAQALKRYRIEVALYHLKDSEQYKAGYLKLN